MISEYNAHNYSHHAAFIMSAILYGCILDSRSEHVAMKGLVFNDAKLVFATSEETNCAVHLQR